MDNKIIINPPESFNHLLFEKYGADNFSITAFNPFGHKAYMIEKNIALIPLSFLTYKLLVPKRQYQPKSKNTARDHTSPTTAFKS